VSASKTSTTSKLAIASANPTALTPSSARVERDPDTGKIIRVIHENTKKANPLNDPLMSDSEGEDDEIQDAGTREKPAEGKEEANAIVRELEAQASMIPERKVRKQSQREREWIARLVERYGTDTKGMAQDRKLNPMQQTEADIARRVRKWRDGGGVVEG
jgi:nucleolar protein 16